MKAAEKQKQDKIMARLESGELADQKCWSFIRDLNSRSEERLDNIAMHDGYRKYTYRQMFRYWERYAEAFTAVHLTGKDKARVGLIGAQQTETVCAFYALNMTGASVSLIYHLDLYDEKRIRNMIEMEKITDLVISEVFAFPKTMERLLRDRKNLGLRNIILLESPMGGEYPIPMLEAIRKTNTLMFREFSGGLLMEDLLREYEATPISYGDEKSTENSIILHTTGTVSGIHKPVPMSDKALNSFVVCALKIKDTYKDFQAAPKHMVSFMGMNLAWVYAMVDMCHTSLGLGMEMVTLPLGVSNPHYAEAIEKYGISILFTSRSMLDTWNKSMPDMNLSSVKVVFMGGSYVSPEFRKIFNDYLQSCGSTAKIVNGYGLSELGGACTVCPSDREDDSIGFPLPGYKAKIYSEEEEKYYDISDGPRTGVLCLSSPTMSSGRLDDTVIFELERIDGEDYFNSNDLVRVNEDGSLTCIGRSNKLFVNNAGIRFDVGLVENAVAAQPGIAACGIAPEFHKILHDNVPVLYVELSNGADGLSTLRKALMQVFITDGKLADTNLPSQCVLTDHIPLNSGGKVDSRRLAKGGLEGKRYNVKHVKLNDRIEDIVLLPVPEDEAGGLSGGIPDELEDDPYNLLSEIFAAIPEIQKDGLAKIFKIPGVRELMLKLTDFDIGNVPGSITRLTPKLMKLSADQPLSRLNGDFKFNDIMEMLQALLTMLQTAETPLFGAKEARMFPMPMMFMPPVLPVLPVFPMPFWGWNTKKGGRRADRKKQDETTASDAEDNTVETADDAED
jgi:acyl-coenzyme A synthetase/AMP-(fatty) acid ligase